jgi:hypothetical protein
MVSHACIASRAFEVNCTYILPEIIKVSMKKKNRVGYRRHPTRLRCFCHPCQAFEKTLNQKMDYLVMWASLCFVLTGNIPAMQYLMSRKTKSFSQTC